MVACEACGLAFKSPLLLRAHYCNPYPSADLAATLTAHKADGNAHFGRSALQPAIECFSDGIACWLAVTESDREHLVGIPELNSLVLALYCNRALALTQLGRSASAVGLPGNAAQFDQAAADASYAHGLDPLKQKPLLRLGDALIGAGRFTEVRPPHRCATISPQSVRTGHRQLAHSKEQSEQKQEERRLCGCGGRG